VDLSEMVNLMLKDKKKSDSSTDLEFVMIKDIGCPEDKVTKIPLSKIISYFSKSI
jgi:3-dehydroquinate synthetase